jgi:hypothetical protein
VGQFKDGLDMSAVREVKYLRELKHQNVIEVSILYSAFRKFGDKLNNPAFRRLLFENKLEPCPRIPRHRP